LGTQRKETKVEDLLSVVDEEQIEQPALVIAKVL
jgi:hypothetical protein